MLKHSVNVTDKKLDRFLLSFFLSSDEVAQYLMNFSWRFSHEFYREQTTTLSLFHSDLTKCPRHLLKLFRMPFPLHRKQQMYCYSRLVN